MTAFRTLVTTGAELRTLIGGDPSALALAKEQRALDVHCRDFIARSPFVLVATANAAGQCDVSPKGDTPGSVLVVDEHRLLIPDRPGNKRLDGMRHLLQNPHVGLIFGEPQRWPALDGLASPARILFDHTRPPGTTVEELERVLQDGYRQRLY
jgi:predicted pyridoxine 5'-phosphate oxidase superfamily flavin-nucleotide-binding protein